jgi:hypothetical protein
MGGFLSLRAMVISKDIKAGVIWSGVVGSYPDMLCCWHHASPKVPTLSPDPDYHTSWRERWTKLYGKPEQDPAFWASISANSYLADLSGPLQIHHEAGDSEVPVQFSQDLYQQVLAAGKTAGSSNCPHIRGTESNAGDILSSFEGNRPLASEVIDEDELAQRFILFLGTK